MFATLQTGSTPQIMGARFQPSVLKSWVYLKAVEEPAANLMECAFSKSASRNLPVTEEPQALQSCVSSVAEVTVIANNLKGFVIPVVILCCSPQVHFCKGREARTKNGYLVQDCGFCNQSAFLLSKIHYFPIFPTLIQGCCYPSLRRNSRITIDC